MALPAGSFDLPPIPGPLPAGTIAMWKAQAGHEQLTFFRYVRENTEGLTRVLRWGWGDGTPEAPFRGFVMPGSDGESEEEDAGGASAENADDDLDVVDGEELDEGEVGQGSAAPPLATSTANAPPAGSNGQGVAGSDPFSGLGQLTMACFTCNKSRKGCNWRDERPCERCRRGGRTAAQCVNHLEHPDFQPREARTPSKGKGGNGGNGGSGQGGTVGASAA